MALVRTASVANTGELDEVEAVYAPPLKRVCRRDAPPDDAGAGVAPVPMSDVQPAAAAEAAAGPTAPIFDNLSLAFLARYTSPVSVALARYLLEHEQVGVPMLYEHELRASVGEQEVRIFFTVVPGPTLGAPGDAGAGVGAAGAVGALALAASASSPPPIDAVRRVITSAECRCTTKLPFLCKHSVALLMDVLQRPHRVHSPAIIDGVLGALSREQLIALIHRLALRHCALVGSVIDVAAGVAAGDLPALLPRAHPAPASWRPHFVVETRAVEAVVERAVRNCLAAGDPDGQGQVDLKECINDLVSKIYEFNAANDGDNAMAVLCALTSGLTTAIRALPRIPGPRVFPGLLRALQAVWLEVGLSVSLPADERAVLGTQLEIWSDALAGALAIALPAVRNGWDVPGMAALLAGDEAAAEHPAPLASNELLFNEHPAVTCTRLRILERTNRLLECRRLALAAREYFTATKVAFRLRSFEEGVPEALSGGCGKVLEAEELLTLLDAPTADNIHLHFSLRALRTRLERQANTAAAEEIIAERDFRLGQASCSTFGELSRTCRLSFEFPSPIEPGGRDEDAAVPSLLALAADAAAEALVTCEEPGQAAAALGSLASEVRLLLVARMGVFLAFELFGDSVGHLMKLSRIHAKFARWHAALRLASAVLAIADQSLPLDTFKWILGAAHMVGRATLMRTVHALMNGAFADPLRSHLLPQLAEHLASIKCEDEAIVLAMIAIARGAHYPTYVMHMLARWLIQQPGVDILELANTLCRSLPTAVVGANTEAAHVLHDMAARLDAAGATDGAFVAGLFLLRMVLPPPALCVVRMPAETVNGGAEANITIQHRTGGDLTNVSQQTPDRESWVWLQMHPCVDASNCVPWFSGIASRLPASTIAAHTRNALHEVGHGGIVLFVATLLRGAGHVQEAFDTAMLIVDHHLPAPIADVVTFLLFLTQSLPRARFDEVVTKCSHLLTQARDIWGVMLFLSKRSEHEALVAFGRSLPNIPAHEEGRADLARYLALAAEHVGREDVARDAALVMFQEMPSLATWVYLIARPGTETARANMLDLRWFRTEAPLAVQIDCLMYENRVTEAVRLATSVPDVQEMLRLCGRLLTATRSSTAPASPEAEVVRTVEVVVTALVWRDWRPSGEADKELDQLVGEVAADLYRVSQGIKIDPSATDDTATPAAEQEEVWSPLLAAHHALSTVRALPIPPCDVNAGTFMAAFAKARRAYAEANRAGSWEAAWFNVSNNLRMLSYRDRGFIDAINAFEGFQQRAPLTVADDVETFEEAPWP